MTTTVVNKRARGFRPNANQRYIGRGSLFGNPFTHLPLSRTTNMDIECFERNQHGGLKRPSKEHEPGPHQDRPYIPGRLAWIPT